MRTAPGVISQLPDLYREAAAATARGSKSFYFASTFFPPELARAAHAVYWFCRTTDDIVDEAPSKDRGRAELDAWQHELRNALLWGTSSNPILRVFVDTAIRHRIPPQYAFELIDGVRMDLEQSRYESFQDLRVFCYRVASTVGLMMSHVIGFDGPALSYAEDLGVAMQLTNILRDIGEDMRMGRIYLPSAEMKLFGYSQDDLQAGVRNAAFRDLMRFQSERARRYYRQARPGIAMLRPEGRFAVRIAADVYERILDRIEAMDYDVFARRAVVSAPAKYWITARNMAVPIARQSMQRLLGAHH